MNALLRQRLGVAAIVRGQPGQVRRQPDRALHIGRAAVAEAGVQPDQGSRGHGGQFRQAWIVEGVAGQHGECDATVPAQRRRFLDAIAPVVQPTQQAHYQAAGAGDDLIQVEVHRHGMAQPPQAGQPQPRRAGHGPPSPGQRTQVRVGETEHHQVGRGLAKVGRCPVRIQRADLADQKVHGR